MYKGNFYSLSSKLSSSTIQAHPTNLGTKEDESGLFDQHKLIKGVFDGISFPVKFKQLYGNRLDDILDTGWPGLFLISDKMKTILNENNLTGWKTFPVQILDKQNNKILGYNGLSIIGRCGQIDFSKSEIIEKRHVPNGPLVKFYKGFHIDLENWNNTDLFLSEKNFGTIITQRTAELLKSNKLSNIRCKNIAEIETPVEYISNMS